MTARCTTFSVPSWFCSVLLIQKAIYHAGESLAILEVSEGNGCMDVVAIDGVDRPPEERFLMSLAHVLMEDQALEDYRHLRLNLFREAILGTKKPSRSISLRPYTSEILVYNCQHVREGLAVYRFQPTATLSPKIWRTLSRVANLTEILVRPLLDRSLQVEFFLRPGVELVEFQSALDRSAALSSPAVHPPEPCAEKPCDGGCVSRTPGERIMLDVPQSFCTYRDLKLLSRSGRFAVESIFTSGPSYRVVLSSSSDDPRPLFWRSVSARKVQESQRRANRELARILRGSVHYWVSNPVEHKPLHQPLPACLIDELQRRSYSISADKERRIVTVLANASLYPIPTMLEIVTLVSKDAIAVLDPISCFTNILLLDVNDSVDFDAFIGWIDEQLRQCSRTW